MKTTNDADQIFTAPASGKDDLLMQVDASNKITLKYSKSFTQATDEYKKYWLVFPAKTSKEAAEKEGSDTPDTCSAVFKHVNQGLYTRNLLVIASAQNGPRYYY